MRVLALTLIIGAACGAANTERVAPAAAAVPAAVARQQEEPVTGSQDTAAPATLVTTLAEVADQRRQSGRAYAEFLRVPALNAGLYELDAGTRDGQSPHDADELYHVVAGRAVFVADGERTPVQPGSLVYVRAGVEHRFEEITEDLSVLVVFAGE